MNSAKELLICFRPIAEGPMEDNAAAGRMAQDDAAGDKSKQEAASNEARIWESLLYMSCNDARLSDVHHLLPL